MNVVTVVYSGWRYTPEELDKTSAEKIKGQFTSHLNRTGVSKVAGSLFAVLHGEFEPTSGIYQLHYHVVTTAPKAAFLKIALTTGSVRGYTRTATGADPVRCSKVGSRRYQFSYLCKAFWPSRPVLMIDGKPKRVRSPRRVPEPFGTQVLLWLDRQCLSDLTVMNGCWSLRKGGTDAMRRLYFFVHGHG